MPTGQKERKGTLDVLLRDRGLTVYSLCKESGIARQTVVKLCEGAGLVRMSTVRKLAAALHMEPSELTAILQGDGIVVGSVA
jgi:DNA-binding Xre family transcriptional regulator